MLKTVCPTAALALMALLGASTSHAAPVPGQGTWETTLQARDLDGDGTVDAWYDTAQQISWLADWNVAGPMSWHDATAWAGTLDVKGVTGWRLPRTHASADGSVKPDPSSSELAHLYYVTWGNTGYPDPGYGLSNTADFVNVLDSTVYWSGTEFSGDPDLAWYFYSFLGLQDVGGYDKRTRLYAVAVRDGDVGLLPEPPAIALAGLGLVGLARRGRRPA